MVDGCSILDYQGSYKYSRCNKMFLIITWEKRNIIFLQSNFKPIITNRVKKKNRLSTTKTNQWLRFDSFRQGYSLFFNRSFQLLYHLPFLRCLLNSITFQLYKYRIHANTFNLPMPFYVNDCNFNWGFIFKKLIISAQ